LGASAVNEVVVPVLTPFKGGALDVDGLKAHVTSLMEAGVDAIFLEGTTGLGPSLTPDERRALMNAASGVTGKVIVQVGGLDMEAVLGLVRAANDLDLLGVASFPPPYYQRITAAQLMRYFDALHEASEHPVYLYNYPAGTGKDLDAKAASAMPWLKGVKDTSESLGHTMDYKRLIPQLKVYNGSDGLIAPSLAFLDGTVPSAANYATEAVLMIRDLIKSGRIQEAMRLQFVINDLVEAGRSFGYLSSVYSLTKLMRGYDVGGPRPPVFPLSEGEEDALKKAIRGALKSLEELGVPGPIGARRLGRRFRGAGRAAYSAERLN